MLGPLGAHGRTVLRDLGVVLHVPGLMALASVPICWALGEGYAIAAFIVTAAAALVPGQALYRRFRQAASMGLRQAMVTAVLSWGLIPLIGTVPFLLVAQTLGDSGGPESVQVLAPLLNAFFESMSGFTSTGLTMVAHPSDLPASLQWWRSFMQWIGGVGVIVCMLSVFHPDGDAYRLYFSEGREQTILPDLAATVRTIWWTYLLYTALAMAALWVSGMSGWEAVNYGMTGIATGGFGITDRSLADFGAPSRLVMVSVMIIGAISFATHYRILRHGQVNLLWHGREIRALFALLILGPVLLSLENGWHDGEPAWLDSLFQWTSALTTSGFATVDLSLWGPTAHVLLSIAMICGGMSGATTGGLKLRRVTLLASGSYARVRGVALHPWRLMEHKPMADNEAGRHAARTLESAAIMALLWLAAILLGAILLLHAAGPGAALDDVIVEAASAVGNVGLSTGITDPGLHWSGKVGLILMMWMGRLEIIPALVLVAALGMALYHLPRLRPGQRSRGGE